MPNRPFSREKETPINWRRGIFRLWILASAAWIMGWVIYFIIDLISGASTSGELLVAPVVLFGPPVALMLFGLATDGPFKVSRLTTASRARDVAPASPAADSRWNPAYNMHRSTGGGIT